MEVNIFFKNLFVICLPTLLAGCSVLTDSYKLHSISKKNLPKKYELQSIDLELNDGNEKIDEKYKLKDSPNETWLINNFSIATQRALITQNKLGSGSDSGKIKLKIRYIRTFNSTPTIFSAKKELEFLICKVESEISVNSELIASKKTVFSYKPLGYYESYQVHPGVKISAVPRNQPDYFAIRLCATAFVRELP